MGPPDSSEPETGRGEPTGVHERPDGGLLWLKKIELHKL